MLKSPESMLEDLYQVGKTKSLGYLPTETIVKLCGKTVEDMISFAQINSLGYVVYKKSESNVSDGCVVFYHEEMLLEMLEKYKRVFNNAAVPTSSTLEYINFIHKNTIYQEKFPDAYIAIGKTFNDHRFKDVDIAE